MSGLIYLAATLVLERACSSRVRLAAVARTGRADLPMRTFRWSISYLGLLFAALLVDHYWLLARLSARAGGPQWSVLRDATLGQLALTATNPGELAGFYRDTLGLPFLFDAGGMYFFAVGAAAADDRATPSRTIRPATRSSTSRSPTSRPHTPSCSRAASCFLAAPHRDRGARRSRPVARGVLRRRRQRAGADGRGPRARVAQRATATRGLRSCSAARSARRFRRARAATTVRRAPIAWHGRASMLQAHAGLGRCRRREAPAIVGTSTADTSRSIAKRERARGARLRVLERVVERLLHDAVQVVAGLERDPRRAAPLDLAVAPRLDVAALASESGRPVRAMRPSAVPRGGSSTGARPRAIFAAARDRPRGDRRRGARVRAASSGLPCALRGGRAPPRASTARSAPGRARRAARGRGGAARAASRSPQRAPRGGVRSVTSMPMLHSSQPGILMRAPRLYHSTVRSVPSLAVSSQTVVVLLVAAARGVGLHQLAVLGVRVQQLHRLADCR